MSITETKNIDQIVVAKYGDVTYREVTQIMRGDEVVAQTYHRTSLTPGQDLTGQPEKVAVIARAAWTPEVIAAYQAHMAAQVAKLGA
jgi:hypothetical protein